MESRQGFRRPETNVASGGGDTCPNFTLNKKKRVYYSEEAAAKEVLSLRHKINYLIPNQIFNKEMARINQSGQSKEPRRNSWENMRSSINIQARNAEERLREIEQETALSVVLDPNTETLSSLQRKYINQKNILATLRGEAKQQPSEVRHELFAKVQRLSIIKERKRSSVFSPLLESSNPDYTDIQ